MDYCKQYFNIKGNSDVLRNMFMAQGKNVMYIGDHLFGDVLKSKKTKGFLRLCIYSVYLRTH